MVGVTSHYQGSTTTFYDGGDATLHINHVRRTRIFEWKKT
jgi:hypothetical protein